MSAQRTFNLTFKAFFLLLFAAAVHSSAQAGNAFTQSQLRGRVLDPDRAAVAGVKITASRNGQTDATAFTNASGEFSLLLEPGEYSLNFFAEGFAEAALIVRSKPTTFEPLEIVLQLAGDSASVTITDMAGYDTFALRMATKKLTALRELSHAINRLSHERIKDHGMQHLAHRR